MSFPPKSPVIFGLDPINFNSKEISDKSICVCEKCIPTAIDKEEIFFKLLKLVGGSFGSKPHLYQFRNNEILMYKYSDNWGCDLNYSIN